MTDSPMSATIRRTSGLRAGVAVLLVAAILACARDDIGAPAAGTVLVNMRDNYFQPQTVMVARGASVRWTNEGATLHSVVSDSMLWQSPLLSPKHWFEVRFDAPGTFRSRCSQHAAMTSTVVVQ